MVHDALLRAAADIYEDQQHPKNESFVRHMRGLAFDLAAMYRNGEGCLDDDSIATLRDRTGSAGVLTLCLAFTTLIGPTSAQQRAFMRGLVDQHAFNPALTHLVGNVATHTGNERRLRRLNAVHCLTHADDWLEQIEEGPVAAIAYVLGLAVRPEPGVELDDTCVNHLVMGLSWHAAWRMTPIIV